MELEAFWQEEWGRVKPWYIKMKKPTDVISTASPDFIVRPVIEKLGVKMIASKVDARGQLVGKNNRREEKVVRWKKEFGAVKIDEFYSDSLKNDAPMAKYALKAYFVKGDKITDWPK